jgi:DNA helicase HerA-like ATPase
LLKIVSAYITRNRGQHGRFRLLLVVDEAHTFGSKKLPSPHLIRVFAELRKYGVIAVAATQQASKLHDEIVANTGYVIALRHVEPRETRYTARLLSGIEEKGRIGILEHTLTSMPRGYALVRSREAAEIVLIQISNPLNGGA